MSNGNLGYLFYRCVYRETEVGSSRLKEKQGLNTGKRDRLFNDAPTKESLSERVKPYRAECNSALPETLDENSLPDLQAMFNAKFGAAKSNSRDAKKAKSKGQAAPAQATAQSQPADPDETARKANGIVGFDLTVQYPGLYAGMGYAHGLPQTNEDIKTGFSFDYTTGLPYIPGSSLKGALRSCFINQSQDVAAALRVSAERLREVEEAVFGNRIKKGDRQDSNELADDRQGCCIFYDVFPVLQDTAQPLMAEDIIAPHKELLKEPNLINTIRLKPGIRLRFYFSIPEVILKADGNGSEVNGAALRNLFKTLLIEWGIGAKTNVGYGNLSAR